MSRFLIVAALLSAGLTSAAGAQCTPGGPPDPAAVGKSIAGIVLDRSNQPLENVDVIVKAPRRLAKTRPDGRFLIQDLDTGVYEVTFRKIGYQIFAWEYVVTDSGGVARVCLAPEVRILPPSVSAVAAGGLFGIIADSMMKPLPGAEVRAMGAGEHAITDSAGAFFMNLRRGSYAIMISKDGFARQLLSVTIPKDSGRQITAFLGSPQRNANRMAANLGDMRQRIAWANPATSGIMSSEDLLRTSADLRGAATKLARMGMADDCPAIIDGGPYSLPLSIIDKRDVAMLEAYMIAAPRRRGSAPRPINSPCPVRVYVWMKP
jgi:hypothetical protein